MTTSSQENTEAQKPAERPVLIVDSLNLFIRSYCVSAQVSHTGGYSLGGTIGFLRSLRRIVEEIQPSRVIVVWEGGGSSKRRSLFKEYKQNRRPLKLNRFYEDDIPDSEDNKVFQIALLVKFLKSSPVTQLFVTDFEADDVIAYLVKGPLKDVEKIIVSSDKDMYQLLDDKTRQYSLHKRTIVTKEDV